MKRILSIDFGTTTTAFAVTTNQSAFEPEMIEIDGKTTTETCLRLDASGSQIELLGADSWEHMDEAPERTFFDFKLKISDKTPFTVGSGRQMTACDLARIFLSKLREKIETQAYGNSPLEQNISTTVIGYPATWTEIQKEATLKVARDAGFPCVMGCEEPIGALYFHRYKNEFPIEADIHLVVYDFGGGTSDVCVMRASPNKHPQVLATAGLAEVGGKFFDERLCQHFTQQICEELSLTELPESDLRSLRREAKRIKEKLSLAIENRDDAVRLIIPMLFVKKSKHEIKLARKDFENICGDLMEPFLDPMWHAVNKAGLEGEKVNILKIRQTKKSSEICQNSPKKGLFLA